MKKKRIYKVTTIKEDPGIMEINSAAAYLIKSYAVEVAEASDRAYMACKYRLVGLVTAINIYDGMIFSEIFRDDNMTMVLIGRLDGSTTLLCVVSRREATDQ